MKMKVTLCFHIIHCGAGSFYGDLAGAGAPACVVHGPKSEPVERHMAKFYYSLWRKYPVLYYIYYLYTLLHNAHSALISLWCPPLYLYQLSTTLMCGITFHYIMATMKQNSPLNRKTNISNNLRAIHLMLNNSAARLKWQILIEHYT